MKKPGRDKAGTSSGPLVKCNWKDMTLKIGAYLRSWEGI